ncbi:MAG TPA: hypothetical protein VJH92_01005 [Candidatus Nanoarchaeia archaeon]|nr:hypothetical protein [Candidatus Nanoarchaeia archaeon]
MMRNICGLEPIWIFKDIDDLEFFTSFKGEVPRCRIRCLPTAPVTIPFRVFSSLNLQPDYYGDGQKFELENIPEDANSIVIFPKYPSYVGLYASTDFKQYDFFTELGIETRTLHFQGL